MSHEYPEHPGDGVEIEGRRESIYVRTKDPDEFLAYERGNGEIGKKTLRALVAYFNKFPDRMENW